MRLSAPPPGLYNGPVNTRLCCPQLPQAYRLAGRGSLSAEVAERQTRCVQDAVPERACGFKSLLRHHHPGIQSQVFRPRQTGAGFTRL